MKINKYSLPSCLQSLPGRSDGGGRGLSRSQVGRSFVTLASIGGSTHLPPAKGGKRLPLLHGGCLPRARSKSSSLATALPPTRRQRAFASPSCSLPSCVPVLVALGALLGSWAGQNNVRLGLFPIFDLEYSIVVAILILLNRMLRCQGDGGRSNVCLKKGQSNQNQKSNIILPKKEANQV